MVRNIFQKHFKNHASDPKNRPQAYTLVYI